MINQSQIEILYTLKNLYFNNNNEIAPDLLHAIIEEASSKKVEMNSQTTINIFEPEFYF